MSEAKRPCPRCGKPWSAEAFSASAGYCRECATARAKLRRADPKVKARERERRAIYLRDLAMRIVQVHGPSYRDRCIAIEYRAQHGDRPHGLDVWLCDDRSTKMLNVIWSDAEAVVIISYQSGPWERALARVAATALAA
jgi:hypothetical protein